MLLHLFLTKSTTIDAIMKDDFLKLYILDPRGHRLALNLGMVRSAAAGEQQADTRKKSVVAAPTLMPHGNLKKVNIPL
jgi:alpha-beta hydrolase superfamily lysophospholipase